MTKAKKEKTSSKKQVVQPEPVDNTKKAIGVVKQRVANLLNRRPHRSFQRTRRRDYVRSLKLPGYWSFTNMVRKMVWQNRKSLLWLAIIYAGLTAIFVGISSQDTYTQIGDAIRTTSGNLFKGNWGSIGQAGLLLLVGATGGSANALTEAQQIYAALIILLTWLTVVWLLRARLAGKRVKLRDALYSAGAPILSTFLVAIVGTIQLFPVALAVIGFGGASTVGLFNGGVEAMIFWTVAALLTALSLYWLTSTFFALVIVTLPGMYPMQAIRTAGDLVVGRRLRILLRLLWLGFITSIVWSLVMIPTILFDTWLKGVTSGLDWLPVVPIALLIMTTLTVIWVASYVYMLYRRIVDDDASPA